MRRRPRRRSALPSPSAWTWSMLGALSLASASGCMIHRIPSPEPPRPPGGLASAEAPRRGAEKAADASGDKQVVPTSHRAEQDAPATPKGEDAPADPAKADEPKPLDAPKADAPPPAAANPPSGPSMADEPDVPAVPAPTMEYPIDLGTALRLASAENPRIAEVRTSILAALAGQQAARALLLPSLNAGVTYHAHLGNLQRSSGRILNLSEQSLYVGGGARTLAAESVGIPAVNIASPLADAIFEPLVARQQVVVAEFRTAATSNAVLLEVATLHLDLIAAETALQMRKESEAQAREIVRTVGNFAALGRGRQADADRAETELRLLRAEIQKTEEEVAVAAARLARRLNLDPSVRLRPLSGPFAPLQLIEARTPTEELVQTAMLRRPEMGATSAQIGAAEVLYREEMARPLLPTLWLGFSGGALGGGSNLVTPEVGHFGGRTDFDVRAFWTVQNFGAGNIARQRRRYAQVGQAVAEQSRAVNTIRREVTSAQAEALAQIGPIEQARRGLEAAERAFNEDLIRIRNAQGRPIEALNSLNLLTQARIDLVRAVTLENQAQFALFVALGSPPPLPIGGPTSTAPPPVNTPLHAPFTAVR